MTTMTMMMMVYSMRVTIPLIAIPAPRYLGSKLMASTTNLYSRLLYCAFGSLSKNCDSSRTSLSGSLPSSFTNAA